MEGLKLALVLALSGAGFLVFTLFSSPSATLAQSNSSFFCTYSPANYIVNQTVTVIAKNGVLPYNFQYNGGVITPLTTNTAGTTVTITFKPNQPAIGGGIAVLPNGASAPIPCSGVNPTTAPPPNPGGGTGGGGTNPPPPTPDPIIKTNSFTVTVYYYLGQTKTPLKGALVTYTDNDASRTKPVQTTNASGKTTISLGATATSSYSLKVEKTSCSAFSQTYSTQPSDKQITLSCNVGKPAVAVAVNINEITPATTEPIVFTVTRYGNLSGKTTVNLEFSGSAKAQQDYKIDGITVKPNATGKLIFSRNFNPNDSTTILTVRPKNLKDGTNIILKPLASGAYTIGNPNRAEVKVNVGVKPEVQMTISVLHPEQNEEYKAGEDEKVWFDILQGGSRPSLSDVKNIASFSLSLAQNGQDFSYEIVSGEPASDIIVNNQYNRFMYEWNDVPCQLSSNAKIKIKAFDSSGNQIAEGISQPFKITHGDIHIISPSSGQVLKGAEETTVVWEGSCLPQVQTTKVSYTITSVPKTNPPNVGVDYSEQLSSYNGIPNDNKMTFVNPVFRNVRANLFVKLYDGNGVELSHSAIPILLNTPKVQISGLEDQTVEFGGILNLSWKIDSSKIIDRFKIYKIDLLNNKELDSTVIANLNTNQYSVEIKLVPVNYGSYNKFIVSAVTKYQQNIGEGSTKLAVNYPVELNITKPDNVILATSKFNLEWTVGGDKSKLNNFIVRTVRESDNKIIGTKTLAATARSQQIDLGSTPFAILATVYAVDGSNKVLGRDGQYYYYGEPSTFYGIITDSSGSFINVPVQVIYKDKKLGKVSSQTIKTIAPFTYKGVKYNFKFTDEPRENVYYGFYIPELRGVAMQNPVSAVFSDYQLVRNKSNVSQISYDPEYSFTTIKCSSDKGRKYNAKSMFQGDYNFLFNFCPASPNEPAIAKKIAGYLDAIRAKFNGKTPDILTVIIKNVLTIKGAVGMYSHGGPFIFLDTILFLDDHNLKHVVSHEYSHAVDFYKNLTKEKWKNIINSALTAKQTCLVNSDPVYIGSDHYEGYSCAPSRYEFFSVWGEQNSLHKDKIVGAISPLDSRRKDIANSLWNLIKQEMRGAQ